MTMVNSGLKGLILEPLLSLTNTLMLYFSMCIRKNTMNMRNTNQGNNDLTVAERSGFWPLGLFHRL